MPEIQITKKNQNARHSKSSHYQCIESPKDGFRYVAARGPDGAWEPVLPAGMRELMAKSAGEDILASLG